MTRAPKVAIIGGGLGGLAAALALRHRGFDFEIYEQTPALSEIGAGLNLSPNALKVFRALGVEDQALPIGYVADDQVIRSWRSGRVLACQHRAANATERFGAAFLCIHRADMLAIFAGGLGMRP